MALKFLQSGDFYWNSGMFIWKTSAIIQALEAHLPGIAEDFNSMNDAYWTDDESQTLEKVYAQCESISIDYGIMEKAANVQVVLCDIGWSDLGTWGSLKEKLEDDGDGNASAHVHLRAVQSRDNLVVGTPTGGAAKLVALKDLEGYIVVDTPHALLICPSKDEQWIKSLVNDLKNEGGEGLV